MRFPLLLLPTVALAFGCAASTYPLNPQLAAQVGLEDPASSGELAVAGPIVQQGSASWYGPRFHGRRTSNGEVFDKNALTAAHPTLPFGSEVEVTDVESGKSVRVRINDRGPFVRPRILDLSYAAAASLDIVRKGVAHVELRLVDVNEADWSSDVYALQVASFQDPGDAQKFLEGLSDSQKAVGLYYVKEPDGDGTGYDVRFGPFTGEKSAKAMADRLRSTGLEPSLLREDLTSTTPVEDPDESIVR